MNMMNQYKLMQKIMKCNKLIESRKLHTKGNYIRVDKRIVHLIILHKKLKVSRLIGKLKFVNKHIAVVFAHR